MSSDALAIVHFLFSNVWLLFTGWHIPGTNVTPAGFIVFLLLSSWVLRHLGKLFDIGGESFGRDE